jgi:hypothetical protein
MLEMENLEKENVRIMRKHIHKRSLLFHVSNSSIFHFFNAFTYLLDLFNSHIVDKR